MGMPERKKGYPRYYLVPSQARLESKVELPTQIGVISKWTQLPNLFSYAIISSSTQNKMNKREERTSHKQAVRSTRFWLGLCEWNLHSRSLGFSLRNARGMVDLTHEPTIRDSAFRFENIGKGFQLIGRYKRLRSSGFC